MSLPSNAKKVFQGVMFEVYQWEQKLFDGSTKTFEAVKRKESVQIIATTKDKKIVLLQEEQPLIGKFLSLPGGICNSNSFFDEAKRELLEETGFECDDLVLWKKTGFSAKVLWDTHYYLAKNCIKTKKASLDAGEKISVFYLSFDEFVEKVLSDEFRNKEFACMLLEMIHKNKLDDFKKLVFS